MSEEERSKGLKYLDSEIRKQWLYTFAGQAMQGMLAFGNREMYIPDNAVPKSAVDLAKALLAELEKEAEGE